jgi:hypothetical protein
MNRMKKSVAFAGVLFILATIGSLVGGTMISAAVPDAYSAVLTAANRPALIAGVLLELVNAVCVAGIGILLSSAFRRGSERAATGYSVLRTIEAVFCVAVVLAPLALLYSAGAKAGFAAEMFAVREGVYGLLVPLFFGIGALVLYGTLFRLRLVPRFISIWGLIATLFIFAVTILGFVLPAGLGGTLPILLGLPIILNELFLGVWLMIKGFAEPAADAAV